MRFIALEEKCSGAILLDTKNLARIACGHIDPPLRIFRKIPYVFGLRLE